MRKILATIALPYANGSLHLGHLVDHIQADLWVRFQKMQGHQVTLVCGCDAHGTPIMIQAQKLGMDAESMVNLLRKEHFADLTGFYISLDNYHSTHSPENEALVTTVFERQKAAGHIAKRVIKQAYDPEKGMFLPDRFIKGDCPRCKAKDQYGDSCEVCGATYRPTELLNAYSTLSGAQPIEKESEHYFFKLPDYEAELKKWTRGGHLQEQVANKLDEWFKDGLQEWDISRDAPYFGFKIPGEANKYFYVWMDAPIGYAASFKNLCATRPDLNFDEYWAKDSKTELYHFIGKDIMYFHALFWPALLSGAQFRTPTAIFVHGFLTIDGQKMSKSRGTFIKARTYLDHLPPEYLRYYFAAKLSSRIEDIDLSFSDFTSRVNSDLVGKFVNIASRTASFITRNFKGALSAKLANPELFQTLVAAGDEIAAKYAKLDYSHAIRQIMGLADLANQYIDEHKPWTLAKDPKRLAEVQDICTMGINLFRLLAIYLKPVLPETTQKIEAFLQVAPFTWEDRQTPLLNHSILEYKPLMTRIDDEKIAAVKTAAAADITASTPQAVAETKTEGAIKELISFEDFAKIDLRVAKILSADHVEGADKLLKLQVDLGTEQRQIFAGIKAAFAPEDLVGKSVVIVANLAPRKMRFGMSEGMMVVANDGESLWLVSPDEKAKPGSVVK